VPLRAELRLRELADREAEREAERALVVPLREVVRRRVGRLPFRRNSAGISVLATSLTSCGISF